jgi:CDP-glucose 4,6-dehydratase
VFLTGHTGFKGAWLSLWLQTMKARVYGFALAPATTPSLFELAHVATGMEHGIGDIRDFESISGALLNAKPEIVVHMAAQALVRESYADPLGTFSTNVMGTAHVLEACRRTPSVRAVVIVTSDKCYQNDERASAYRENDRLGGDDPYSASKAAAEQLTNSYMRSFFPSDRDARVASARAGNVIGGGDWAEDRLLPDFIRAVTRREPLRIRNPNATRPWQYVLEPLSGYLVLAQRLFSNAANVNGAWNFGPADAPRTVLELVEDFGRCWPDPVVIEIDRNENPKESGLLRLDCSKAATQLGWWPHTSLDTGLQLTANWYVSVSREPSAARRCTLDQIKTFEATLAA